MNEILTKILETKIVSDLSGNEYKLHSHTRKNQGYFLQKIVEDIKPKKSVEIGLAYGISSLFICESLRKNGFGHHYIMDPYQKHWKNIGLKNISDAGFSDLVEFHEEFADKFLSKLFLDTVKIDFAYLDGSKVFDVVLFNVYILAKIFSVGGILVLDDCTFPGIKKVTRFLNNHPSFKFYSGHGAYRISPLRRSIRTISKFSPLNKIISEDFKIASNGQNLDFQCIAFKKVKDDNRKWNWHKDF